MTPPAKHAATKRAAKKAAGDKAAPRRAAEAEGATAAPARAWEDDPGARFLESLSHQGCIPLLKRLSGSVRFEIVDEDGHVEQRLVEIQKGYVTVSHKRAKADATVRFSRELSDKIATGRANSMAALLRGELSAEGNLSLVMAFQRLYQGPPGDTGRVPPIAEVPQER